ncbi:DUF4158 domain-containing protein [Nocardia sp. NBC_00881]|uniref:DUF4158 domain-containing protein n=1 Tax=Nocardia sp. NBC_00881 TaxID=2975995 RepID=UPI003863EC92
MTRVAEQLGLDPQVLQGYGRRAHTRTDHLALAAKYLGWKTRSACRGPRSRPRPAATGRRRRP